MSKVRIREALEHIPRYKAGARPAEREDLVTYKISSNENPYPPLDSVRAVLAEAGQHIHRYPDPHSADLVSAIAARWDVAGELVALGTGSVGVCQQIVQSVAGPGDEVLYAWRSFEAYPIITTIAGATAVQVPLRSDEGHDLDAMAAAITDRTRVVFVCTPNNPTGVAVTRDEFDRFMQRVPEDVLVVLDEAYVEFVADTNMVEGRAEFERWGNVAVLRTFSKAYGLAGLRVGFAIAPEPVADALRKTAVPFGVSNMAQQAAVASLEAEDELQARVAALVAERTRMHDELARQGWQPAASQANFVWLRLGERTLEFAQACEEVGLTIRAFAGEGVRVTVAEVEANTRFLELTRDLAARGWI